MAYDIYPAVDEGYNFPPEVRQSIAAASEVQATIENTMGEVVDDLVADAISKDPNIEQAAIDAVEPVLLSTNVVRAYPEGPVQQTSKTEIPMWWTYKVLNDPYRDQYTDLYEGTWSGSLPVRGNVPILNANDQLFQAHLPPNVVTRDLLPGLLPPQPDASDISELIQNRIEANVSSDLPIFGARNAVAKKAGLPTSVVVEGSSTSWYNPGYVAKLTSKLQNTYITEDNTKAQWNSDHNFTNHTMPGLHVYNGAQSGANSGSYLSREEIEKLAPMKPALMIHMIGSNDFKQQMAIATFKANVIQRIQWCDEIFTDPCQHLLVLSYERMDNPSPTIPWSAYGIAQQEIAESHSNVVFRDLSGQYRTVGVPGLDPLDLITTDLVHQTASGNEFLADLMTNLILQTNEDPSGGMVLGAEWRPITLASGIVQQGGYVNECRLEASDVVRYRGGVVMTGKEPNTTIILGTIDPSYRPIMSRYADGVTNNVSIKSRITVNSNGQLSAQVDAAATYLVYDFTLAK